MHTDRKIGFAMGILLIGIVAALFFRNEPLLNPELPTVRREHELNERLRERDVAVYLNDSDKPEAESTNSDQQRWTLKEVLDNMGSKNKSRPSPVGAPVESNDREAATTKVASGDEVGPIPSEKKVAAKSEKDKDVPVPVDSATPLAEPAEPIESDGQIASLGGGPVADSTTKDEDTFQPPENFEEYVVKYGDTLSGIAQKFLGSQGRYQEIYEANRDRMSSPDRLDVGKPLRIPRVADSDPSGTH